MNVRRLLCALVFVMILGFLRPAHAGIITTLNRNDPVPVYTVDTSFARMGTHHFEYLKGQERDDYIQHISLEVLPFYQRANRGTDAYGNAVSDLSSLDGRWNMIAILPFNELSAVNHVPSPTSTKCDIPAWAEEPIPTLVTVRNNLLNQVYAAFIDPDVCPQELKSVEGMLGVQQMKVLDSTPLDPDTPQNNLGYFTVPMRYKKYGVRFDLQAYLLGGFGLEAQFGAATIQQAGELVDTTPRAALRNPFANTRVSDDNWKTVTQLVSDQLMAKHGECFRSMGQSACKFQQTSSEDVHLEAYWRWPIVINGDADEFEYAKFLFIPFVRGGGSLFWSKERDPNFLFSLPFGNNGHDAWRMAAGFSFNFFETVQLSFEAGGTFFNTRKYCNIPVPTNDYQCQLYPYRADICVKPGNNWHVVLGMYAPYFLDRFSCNVDYVYVNHARNTITLLTENKCSATVPATCANGCAPYRPCILECQSPWVVQLLNTSITCDLSTNFKVGAFIQIPLRRRNAYRAATYALSVATAF